MEKPYSQACENNKGPILKILSSIFKSAHNVLEIGSGTGQHAVYFAANLPHLSWYTADQQEYIAGINAWIDDFPSPNLHRPVKLSLPHDPWPEPNAIIENNKKKIHENRINAAFDAYYTANTAHIMQKEQVQFMMQTIEQNLPSEGVFCQYGPFTIDFKFTSQSNIEFHQNLLNSGYGGYRDLSELKAWAPKLKLTQVIDMPANNHILVWQK